MSTIRSSLSFGDPPVPTPGPGAAVVRTHAVSLYGTDLHIHEDGFPTDLPLVQGHEIAGVVVIRDDAGTVRVGERVTVAPLVSSGECRA
ncbi:alcohol dehydrogenase catalytic domain-containing protein [Pseudoclavibacter chungangensis]|uniref:Alcohol dehydrogenase catalytic domain-containing protein n=1 Tax=Pseudoclavibacter chungangensis TaxID=587635 RepID=A0A7J5BM05_9MICO|nr:alcohol dehydrogenase catalytic domain-containing protein [Pseudoclavibacter chungangensis]KAB1651643.1 alcohol dehydrogenase catalytic domain-containing protein [Pseudoclavibacter chungangensis]